MKRVDHSVPYRIALFAHALAFTLGAIVARAAVPFASELAHTPSGALARGIAVEGLIAWWTRVEQSFLVGLGALAIASTLLGSLTRLAIVRATHRKESASLAIVGALRDLPSALLARLALLVATAVAVAIASLPCVLVVLLCAEHPNVRVVDIATLCLASLPLVTLALASVLDDLTHASIVVHGRRPLEALVLATRGLVRPVLGAALATLVFALGVRLVTTELALALESGASVTLVSFTLLASIPLLRARLLEHYVSVLRRRRA